MCSVHTCVEFEKRGIPAAVVVHSAFKKVSEFQFKGKGMPGHPCVEIPNLDVVASMGREEFSSIVRTHVGDVVHQLTKT